MLRAMKDAAVLDFLVERFATKAKLAEAIGVTPQALQNWYDADRGVSPRMRPKVWAMANDHGANLPREWLFDRAA